VDDFTVSKATNSTASRGQPHKKRNRMLIAIVCLVAALVLVEIFLGFKNTTLKLPLISEPTGVAKIMSISGDGRYQPSEEQKLV
jgi:hypothetical protein